MYAVKKHFPLSGLNENEQLFVSMPLMSHIQAEQVLMNELITTNIATAKAWIYLLELQYMTNLNVSFSA